MLKLLGSVPIAVIGPVTRDAAKEFGLETRIIPMESTTDALVAELRAQLAEMRQQRDAWQGIAERLALGMPKAPPAPADAPIAPAATPPASRLRRAWRWMRATG